MENEIIRSLLRAALTSDLMSANELGESSSELDKIVTLVGKAKHEDAEVWKAQAHWAFFQHRQEKRAAERDQWKVRNAQMTSRITARELEAMCDPCAFDPDELFAARAAE